MAEKLDKKEIMYWQLAVCAAIFGGMVWGALITILALKTFFDLTPKQ